MAMGVHMDKDCAPAVDAIATRFSSISSSVSARASGSSQTAGLRPWSARIRASEVVLPNALAMILVGRQTRCSCSAPLNQLLSLT